MFNKYIKTLTNCLLKEISYLTHLILVQEYF